MNHRLSIPTTLTSAIALSIASVCVAQPPQRVDPGSSDASSNAVSLRHMEVDLRHPSGFEGVYQLSKVDAFGRGQNMFMRIDGGVIAVFPRSVYVPTPEGMLPEIPPGTIFYIGATPPPPPDPSRGHIAPTFLNTEVSTRLPAAAEDLPIVRELPVARSLITNEAYRHRRIEALLDSSGA